MIVIVGTFTTPQRRGTAKGLRSYRVAADGWHLLQELPADNPSYIVRHPVLRNLIYTCHSDDRKVSAARVGDDGTMEWVGECATGGDNGAHLAVANDGSALIVANFSSGSISVVPLDAAGRFQGACDTMALQGATGPHPLQTASQPHQIKFSACGRFFFVPDRGCDTVHVFSYQSARDIQALPGAVLAPGSGPRHMEWHPNKPIAYVLNELDCSVAACQWNESERRLEPGANVATRPAGITKESIAAAVCVSPDGRFVYTTTRGHDCITAFQTGADALHPKAIDFMDDVGSFPRFMEMDADAGALWVTSNRSNDIIRVNLDKESGKFADTWRFQSASPTCLLFMH